MLTTLCIIIFLGIIAAIDVHFRDLPFSPKTKLVETPMPVTVEVLEPSRQDLQDTDGTVGKVLRIVAGGSTPFGCRYFKDDVEEIATLLRDCVTWDGDRNQLVFHDNDSFLRLDIEKGYISRNEQSVSLSMATYSIGMCGRMAP